MGQPRHTHVASIPPGSLFDSAAQAAALRHLEHQRRQQDALQRQEADLRRQLADRRLPAFQRRLIRDDLRSFRALARESSRMEHRIAEVLHLDEFLAVPSRRRLFAQSCSRVHVLDWARHVRSRRAPAQVGSATATRQHLKHCPYCALVRRLAQGRLRAPKPGRPLWGDRLLEAYVDQATCAVADPDPLSLADVGLATLSDALALAFGPWRDAPPQALRWCESFGKALDADQLGGLREHLFFAALSPLTQAGARSDA